MGMGRVEVEPKEVKGVRIGNEIESDTEHIWQSGGEQKQSEVGWWMGGR